MARKRTVTTAALAALATLTLGFSAPGDQSEDGYIVLLHDSSVSTAANSLQTVESYGAEVTITYRSALNGYAVQATSQQASALAGDASVRKVVPDGEVRALAVQEDPPWHLDRLDQPDQPMNDGYEYPDSAGEGVTAYVLDTGVRITHEEFGGRASYGINTTDDSDEAPDGNGHGTHLAGVIAGAEYGVAKKADVVAVKVLGDDGSGTISGVIAGIDWVTQNADGPSVANLSLGGDANEALDEAVQRSIDSGIPYSVAAGASASDASQFSPARVEEAVTVSSTDLDDSRASFSNYGSVVDTHAPGVDVTAAWNTSDTALETLSGTSVSAALVAGAIAVELGENPDSDPSQVDEALNSYAAKDVVGDPGSGTPNVLLQVRPVE